MARETNFYGDCGDDDVIATFGGAQLVRHLSGRYELRGGAATHSSAKEWISLFLHEAVVAPPPPQMSLPISVTCENCAPKTKPKTQL